MVKRRRFPKIFFGWWTVLAGSLLGLWGWGYFFFGMSALFKPIASELGLSRAATSVASSIGRAEGGFEALVVGGLADKFGPRWIMALGVFIIGLGLVLMNFINSLWAFYVVWGGMVGSGCNIGLGIPFEKAISNWFVKKRGLAISIRWVFTGLVGIMLPLVAWLITVQGWRMTCVTGGVVMWLVGLPLVWFFIKQHRPEYYGLLPDGATMKEEAADTSQMIDRGVKYAAEVEEVEFTLRQTVRTPAYWLVAAAAAGHSMVFPIVSIHCIPLLTDMGVDPVKAAVIMGMIVLTRVPTALLAGLVADRLKKQHLRFLMGGAYFLEAAGFTIFLLNPTIAMVYVSFVVFYFAFGVSVPLTPIIETRYFGRKAFGSIRGTWTMLTAPFGVVAPVYAGWVYDTTGSYITAFTLLVGLIALSAVLMLLAFPPKPPAQVTDISKIF